MTWNLFSQEAKNAPVSFLGGVIAILGLIYSAYVFVLNGNIPVLDFGGSVLKLLILIVIEAPLAYFFVHLHIKIAKKGHGLPVILNLLSICISALVTCFNVSVLSFQDMLQGSNVYYIFMVLISLCLAIYLLASELLFNRNDLALEGKSTWFGVLTTMYCLCFAFTAFSIFPDAYQKACEARIDNGEDWKRLSVYQVNCDKYISNPKELYEKAGKLQSFEQ